MPDEKIKPTLFRYHDFFIESLMEAFGEDQKKKWSESNPNLEPSLIDTYIKWFNDLRNSKPAAAKTINIDGVPTGNDRFDISKYKDWTSFESFVDAVRTQIPMGSGKMTTQLEIDGKPLFEKNGLEVYYADTPRACIKYKGNVPYGWCIARADSSNMFYTYRLRDNQPAFYFVKDVEETKKELESFSGKFKNPYHFFVIQVLKNAKIHNTNEKSYIATSANNDGDKKMSWSEIVNIQPKLKGLQNEFDPKPLSSEEHAKVTKYKDGITSEEFATLPYEEKERFLDIYPSIGKPISDEIFKATPDDLKNKYIGMNIGLSDKQYENIQSHKKLLNRYVQIVERKFQEWLKNSNQFKLVDSEMDVLIKYNILDKYIDKLSDDNIGDLLQNSPDPQKMIEFLLSKNIPLTDNNVSTLLQYSPDKQKMIDILLSKNIQFTDSNISNLLKNSPDPQKMIEFLLSKNIQFTDSNIYNLLRYSSDKQKMIEFLLSKGLSKGLSIDKILTRENVHYLLTNSKDTQKTIDLFLSKGVSIDKILKNDTMLDLLDRSSDTQKTIKTIDLFLSKGLSIDKILTDYNVHNLLRNSPDKQKMIDLFLSKGLSIGKILTDKNVEDLLSTSIYYQQTINILLSNGLSIDKILTGENLSNLLRNSKNQQEIIDFLLSKGLSIDKILTGENVFYWLYELPDPQKTIAIDFLLSKNIPLTDNNVSTLLRYSPNKPDTQRKIDALKAKQQLSESKFRYRDFFI